MRIALLVLMAVSAWAANPPNQIAVLLDANATTAVLTNSGSAGGTETFRFAPASGQKVRLVIIPINVPPTDATTYTACADPCGTGGTVALMTADLGTGQFYRWGEYVDGSGNPLSPRKKISKLIIPQHEIAVVTTSPLPMPREVIGQDKYATHVQLSQSIGTLANGTRLWLRINNPGYSGKLSVQINGKKPSTAATGWDDITSTATILDEPAYYGAYGSNPIQTFIVTMPITSAVVTSGANSFGLRMNLTDGVTSGARILELNVIEADRALVSISVTSNVATVTTSGSHSYTTGDEVKIHGARGIYGRFNGSRTITVTGATTFTFVPCGTNPNLVNCTSPNEASGPAAPVSQNPSVPVAAQPVAYAARQLIPQSAFVWDAAPSAAPGGSDANAGQTLWNSADLVVPNSPFIGYTTVATCGSCHAVDGRDLKYHNYSNYSIKQRSIFHGLTPQNGEDIAAYIRGLDVDVPTMARPWNPPYQPCPTLDSLAVNNWGAGGGIDCVLTYSTDWLEYAAPGGSYALWQYNQNFPVREVPLPFPFFDWNQWLPSVWPEDSFKAVSFEASTVVSQYDAFRAGLVAGKQSGTINAAATTLVTTANFGCTNNDYLMIEDELVRATAGCGTTSLTITRAQGGTTAASHTGARIGDFTKYSTAGGGNGYGNLFGYSLQYGTYLNSISPTGNGLLPDIGAGQPFAGGYAPSTYVQNFFSVRQYPIVKIWELEHEFNLEGMLGQVFLATKGACTTCPGGAYQTRGWYYPVLFNTGFHKSITHSVINPIDSPALPNGQGPGHYCQTNFWYVGQGVVNPGNRWQSDDNPLDVPYTYGFLNDCGGRYRPGGMLSLFPSIVSVQNSTEFFKTEPTGLLYYLGVPGFVATYATGGPLFATNQSFLDSTALDVMYTQWATAFKSIIDGFSTPTWTALASLPYVSCFSNTFPAQYVESTRKICDGLALAFPKLVYFGVDSSILDAIQTWAEAMFPAVNWTTQRNATCTPTGTPAYPQCNNVP